MNLAYWLKLDNLVCSFTFIGKSAKTAKKQQLAAFVKAAKNMPLFGNYYSAMEWTAFENKRPPSWRREGRTKNSENYFIKVNENFAQNKLNFDFMQ